MSRLLVCLLMVFAALPVLAREIRLQGANGDGGTCPEAAAEVVVQPRNKGKRAAIAAPEKAKPSSTYRGEDGNGPRTPRWHSFVPGMFR